MIECEVNSMPDTTSVSHKELSAKMDSLLTQNSDMRVELVERIAIMEERVKHNYEMLEQRIVQIEDKQKKSEKLIYTTIAAFIGVLVNAFLQAIGVKI